MNYPIKFNRLSETARIFSQEHSDDVAYSVYADGGHDRYQVYPGCTIAIPTGISLEIPIGVAGLILPRSGMAANFFITIQNSPGLIDPGYRGEIKVLLRNEGQRVYEVYPGNKIAQIMFVHYDDVHFLESESLSETDRGVGGFGSTGA